ncbi:hypothetical protein [uncultured Mucilaginibacter sp.]|uniref:hypothetical protein n=1 Tax=uncultured Mucilaginibacter sp. TaxID=797541 RepID=UPI00262808A2|nr:hypothetical protein [uncultured Mucilaginibacter sp.]
MKQHNGMRPHDIVVLLKILVTSDDWLNKDLAKSLYISTSEISESLNRSKIAGLIDLTKRTVFKKNLLDFLSQGLSYVFPVQAGALVRGIPTAHSAPVFKDALIAEDVYVWPYAAGTKKGQAVQPLYPNSVLAVQKDEKLYDVLALVDALRIGKVREREIAINKLADIFKQEYAH